MAPNRRPPTPSMIEDRLEAIENKPSVVGVRQAPSSSLLPWEARTPTKEEIEAHFPNRISSARAWRSHAILSRAPGSQRCPAEVVMIEPTMELATKHQIERVD